MGDISAPVLTAKVGPVYSASDLRVRQIARVISHLRDKIAPQVRGLIMPSRDMIRYLVANVQLERYQESDNWDYTLTYVLQHIRDLTNVGLDGICELRHPEGHPLFPNHEGFDEWDAYRFTQALLHEIDAKTTL